MTVSIRKQFDSSNLAHGEYDAEACELKMTFQNGDVYVYKDVPADVFNQLCSVTSAGAYFYREIRGVFDFEKVTS